ncbi:hypothetical protein U1Q18_013794 [Sarracenia purpurea var. burkii]
MGSSSSPLPRTFAPCYEVALQLPDSVLLPDFRFRYQSQERCCVIRFSYQSLQHQLLSQLLGIATCYPSAVHVAWSCLHPLLSFEGVVFEMKGCVWEKLSFRFSLQKLLWFLV